MLLENQEKIKNLFLNEKYHQVRKLTSKLISVSPNNAELYSIRGRAFRCQHFYKKAHEDFMQAYLLDPNSIVLKKDVYQSTLDKTFNDLLRQYSYKSKKKQTIKKLIELISTATKVNTSLSNLEFEKLLLDLIAHKIPQQNVRGILFRAQSVKLKRLSEIEAFEKLNNRHNEEKNQIIRYFVNDKLFRFILSADFNTNLRMELIIRSLRREIFLNFEKYRGISGIEKLVNSISKQVFLNEYIYDETKEESARIKHMQNYFSSNTGNKDFDINQVALLSMYQDISYLPNIETAEFSPNFSEIKKTHIIDKEKESELATSLKKVSVIADKTSKSVKKQYEENPYPRWNGVVERQPKRHPLKKHLEKLFNLQLNNSFFNKTQKRALIAGCGTGLQIYNLTRYVNDITLDAFDLSFRSLAYAKRVINELDIQNVAFLQGDILNVQNLYENKFDYIECGGVLHHLKKPEEGLIKLSNVLNDDGLLFLGLYSRKAREKLNPVREFIKKEVGNFGPESKYLREKLIFDAVRGNRQAQDMFECSRDIFNMSGYRDLLFHTQESEYNLLEISKLLEDCGLRFLNMADGTVRHTHLLKKEELPRNLAEWAEFEIRYPDAFIGMYQFLVQKI